MSDWIQDTLYPNGVLKNKLNIQDQKKLDQIEYLQSSRRAAAFLHTKPKIERIQDLKVIHKIMFGKLYDWAGEYRQGNFQKNDFDFFDYTSFDYAETNINNIMHGLSPKKALVSIDYANLLDEINFMHPFREGNGRSCKVFLAAYAANHGQTLDYPRKNEAMIQAQSQADVEQIAKLITVQNMPNRQGAFDVLIAKYNKIHQGFDKSDRNNGLEH